MSMVSEFKDFVSKGNVLDLAVGVVIGAAFGKIVTSLVGDIIMPVLGVILGAIDLSGLKLSVADGLVVITYGKFLQASFDFLIIAFALFLVVRAANKFKKTQEALPIAPSNQEVLLAEIRDLLKK